uniref:SSNA1 protein n=1 Tax=Anas platyrhynchos TaxID=8839 RepID=A0A8B9ZJJ4_ANAPL
MGEAGAALQGYNAALLEGERGRLRARRDELSERIREEEAERGRLARTNESLAGHLAARSELDRSIAETEAAYGKILESSQTLLDVLKGEIGNASKASEPKNRD